MSTRIKEPAGTSTVSTPSDREIRIERIFDAPRERVWRAFTDPELVAQWWGRGNKLVIERLEVQRGGHWRFVEHTGEGPQGFEGRFREVTPPQRLVQRKTRAGEGGRATAKSPARPPTATLQPDSIVFHAVTRRRPQYAASRPAAPSRSQAQAGLTSQARTKESAPQKTTHASPAPKESLPCATGWRRPMESRSKYSGLPAEEAIFFCVDSPVHDVVEREYRGETRGCRQEAEHDHPQKRQRSESEDGPDSDVGHIEERMAHP